MDFRIMDEYEPINWDKWKENWKGEGKGKGQNIKPFLSQEYWEIWKAMLPNQDQRNDPGHGEVVTYFACELCGIFNENPDVVIPAAIFHDTGYEVGGDEFRKAFLDVPKNEQEEKEQKLIQRLIRLEHQIIGSHKAYDFLNIIEWPVEHISEIQYIINDHDTRILETTMNGKIMQDADILWRFTLAQMEEYYDDIVGRDGSLLNYMENVELAIPNRFHYLESEKIARNELVNTLYKSKWPEDSFHKNPEIERHIKENYPQELEKIVEVYS